MSRLICLLFVFRVTFFSAQKETKFYNLTISTDQEISLHGKFFWDKVYLIGKKDSVCLVNSEGYFLFKKIPPGKYNVCLVSRFNQTIQRKISISKNTSIKIRTKKKLRSTSPKSFVSKIKSDDTLFILHNATGTSLELLEFRIVKENQKIFILKYFQRQLVLKRELDVSGFDIIKKFESELIAGNFKVGCSVIETYTLCLRGKYFSVNDNSCTWNGLNSIKTSVLSVEE